LAILRNSRMHDVTPAERATERGTEGGNHP
jgi:hypothetical protein